MKGADLHTHTTASDGEYAPAEVVAMAAAAGLEAVAITDHDSMVGVDEALTEGRRIGFTVVPGVELSTEWERDAENAQEVHILGYFADPNDERLARHMFDSRDDRESRGKRIVEKLNGLGFELEWARVLAIAGEARIGRPHIARAMLETGRVSSLSEVFDKWIGNDGPAYVGRSKLSPVEAVEILRAAGAVTSLAHPMYDFHGGSLDVEALLPLLSAVGLNGLECYCAKQSADVTNYYLRVAAERGLLVTGGSDFHGATVSPGVQVGSAVAPHDSFAELCALNAARARPA